MKNLTRSLKVSHLSFIISLIFLYSLPPKRPSPFFLGLPDSTFKNTGHLIPATVNQGVGQNDRIYIPDKCMHVRFGLHF